MLRRRWRCQNPIGAANALLLLRATCASLSRPGARTVQLGAFRSASRVSLLCLPLLPAVFCKSRKAACLLQIASKIFREELRFFRVPARSSRDARGNLQTLPIQLAPASIVMQLLRGNVQ